jgi:hypothetical protein
MAWNKYTIFAIFGLTVAGVERWLGSNLNYDPDSQEQLIRCIRDSPPAGHRTIREYTGADEQRTG